MRRGGREWIMKPNKDRWGLLLIALLVSGVLAQSCTPEDIREYLETEMESEIVGTEQKKQQAKEPQADTQPLEQPNRSRISVGKYAYGQLGEQEQLAYDEMLSAILEHEEKIRLSTLDLEVMQRAYTAIGEDYGGLFWVEGYVYTRYTRGEELVSLEFSPKYTMSKEERNSTQAQIDSVVEEWLGGISILDADYDKVKYVYELLAQNTEYVPGAANSQNIISVFLTRKTVCQGYACAVQYLLGQLGVEGAIISGSARGESHAWNLISMDGEYYYMDSTWGNTEYNNGEGEGTPFIDYNYMAMTTEEMLREHTPDVELKLPECASLEGNYFRREGKYLTEWDSDWIGGLLAEAWANGQAVTLRFSEKGLKDQAFQYFITDGHIADYCGEIRQINYMNDEAWLEISFLF